MADTYRPALFSFFIPQGQHFHLEFPPFLDATTGVPFDFTADPGWIGRVDVVEQDGTAVVSFATSGEDGLVTLDSQGVPSLDLAAAFTAALEPTTEYGGAAKGPYYGDLVLTDPTDSEPWLWFKGTGHVTREVTS